jgi:NADH:ubiquinone oxidoreductase subunit F (NADH-binding)/NADH:ubiquinone oxidoreductase subunit E
MIHPEEPSLQGNDRGPKEVSMIFDELRILQREHGYLPPEELRSLAKRVDVPLHRIHSVASFYPQFHLTPQPLVKIGVCSDITCHLRGARCLSKAIRQRVAQLGPDVAVEPVSCLGQCDRAPAITVNGHIFADVTADSAYDMAEAALAGQDIEKEFSFRGAYPTHFSAVSEATATGFASDPYRDGRRYGALKALVKTRDWDGVIQNLKNARLVGMGGAGFPTATKWETVRKAPGPVKYVVCNADESEPGTVKDRCILEHLPHLVIEGMIICGLVTGAKTGFLYIRHEYEHEQQILRDEIEKCQQAGLLGNDILGSGLSFDIELFVSPGGYICGEGSALLEAIEGNRAEPRIRPPNSATHGLWQKPTALNNVETFAIVPQILFRGVAQYKALGFSEAAPGLKFVSVTGDVCNPGVFEIRMGTPLSEVVMEYAGGPPDGRKVKALSPSGAASGFLPPAYLRVPLDFKSMAAAGTMLGSGAIVVFAEGRCMLDMALNTATFFRNESCGKCVPCRLGSQKLVDLLTGWTEGRGEAGDIELIDALSQTLKQTSICGLGQFIPLSILTVLEHFREEAFAHLFERTCPEGVCPMRA